MEKKSFNFYCLCCKTPFESDEWEFGRYGRGWNGHGRNFYVKAVHLCGNYNYRAISRKDRADILYDRQNV